MKTKDEVLQEFRIQAIREAAGRVVAEKGIEATTMEAIAEAAGIAKGTIYLYFKNREDLLEKTAEHALGGLVSEMESTVGDGGPFRQQFEAFIRRTLQFFDTQRDFFRLYRAVVEHAGRCEVRHQHPLYQRYLRDLTGWLAAATSRGDIAAGDPQRVALVLAEAIHAVLMQRAREEERRPIEEEAAWLSALLLDGIAPQGGRS